MSLVNRGVLSEPDAVLRELDSIYRWRFRALMPPFSEVPESKKILKILLGTDLKVNLIQKRSTILETE